MTIRQFFILDGIGSPYISNRQPTAADLAIFLWILSPKYTTSKADRDKFCAEIYGVEIFKATKDIERYITATFQDAETSDGQEKRYASFITYLIDLYGREYGWKPEQIMELPMRQLYQLNTAISERYAKANGEKYNKLRAIDMMEAQALLDEARRAKKAE